MKKSYQYQIVSEQRQPAGHMMYQLRHKTKNGAIIEFWVGVAKLKRYYQKDKIVGQMGNTIRAVVGREPKKAVKKEKLTPRTTEEGPIYNNLKDMDFTPAKVWNLPETFNVEQLPKATGRAYYIEKDGRYCVVLPDGTLDDEWTNLMMAEIYRDSLNNELDELKK